jgi:hypothetical protein
VSKFTTTIAAVACQRRAWMVLALLLLPFLFFGWTPIVGTILVVIAAWQAFH